MLRGEVQASPAGRMKTRSGGLQAVDLDDLVESLRRCGSAVPSRRRTRLMPVSAAASTAWISSELIGAPSVKA